MKHSMYYERLWLQVREKEDLELMIFNDYSYILIEDKIIVKNSC